MIALLVSCYLNFFLFSRVNNSDENTFSEETQISEVQKFANESSQNEIEVSSSKEQKTENSSGENSDLTSESEESAAINSENQVDNSKLVKQFVTAYYDTVDYPIIKDRVEVLSKNNLITDKLAKHLKESIGDLENEDAKMTVKNIKVYDEKSSKCLAVFDIEYSDVESSIASVYVVEVSIEEEAVNDFSVLATANKVSEE